MRQGHPTRDTFARMLLLVLRHGEAEDAGPRRGDSSRRLTPKGRGRLERACRGLVRALEEEMGVAAEAIHLAGMASSPLVRAVQSADVLAAALRARGASAGERETLDALVPLADPREALGWLAATASAGGELAAVVGHEPHLGRLVSLLVSGRDASRVRLRKGGAALLDVGDAARPGGATLLWLLRPSHARAMR